MGKILIIPDMNEPEVDLAFARKTLRKKLAQCSTEQQCMFIRKYGNVATMCDKHINYATGQCVKAIVFAEQGIKYEEFIIQKPKFDIDDVINDSIDCKVRWDNGTNKR